VAVSLLQISSKLDAGDSSSYSGSGTTWYDISSNSVDVELINGPTYSSTEGGGSISFDGVNDRGRIEYDNAAPIRPTFSELGSNGFTVQAWIKQDIGDSGTIWSAQMYGQRQYYGLMVAYDNRTTNGGRIVWHMFDGDGNYASYSRRSRVSTNTGNTSDWKLVTWRFDSNTNTSWTGFVNTTKFTSGTTSGTGSGLGYKVNADGSVATRKTASTEYVDVQIGAIMCYDVALTDQQVTDNYNATKTRFGHT